MGLAFAQLAFCVLSDRIVAQSRCASRVPAQAQQVGPVLLLRIQPRIAVKLSVQEADPLLAPPVEGNLTFISDRRNRCDRTDVEKLMAIKRNGLAWWVFTLALPFGAYGASAGGFKGYPCTSDCSGHEAGYEWAEQHNIDDEGDCNGNSTSFNEGCEAFVEEQKTDDAASTEPEEQ